MKKLNVNIIVIIMLIIGFLVTLSAILISANCEKEDFDKCILEKVDILPDPYWHFNIIKYVSSYGEIPYKVSLRTDGGPKGDLIIEEALTREEEARPIFHPPLYYFLAAIPYEITGSLLILYIFSIIIILLANIVFFFFLKEVSKKIQLKDTFIIYSLALFIFLPIQLFTSIMVHPSPLFTLFFIISLYFFMKAMNSLENKNFILLGIAMGLSMLIDLKGFVLPLSLFIYLFILLFKKRKSKIKLFCFSLLISILIGSYQFIKNFLMFGSPFGNWRIETSLFFNYKFTKLFQVFTAYWGGVFGGNDFIYPILIILISILILITIYSLISLKFGKNLNLDFIVLTALITSLLLINMICNFTYFLEYLKCGGVMGHARYLIPVSPVIAILPSIIF